MSSRTRNAVLGFLSDVGGLIALTTITFIAAPIILELTSQTLYGFWITTISILGYLALTDLGLGMSLTRFVASLASKGQNNELNGIISTAFFTFCGIGIVFLLIGFSISSYIPLWFNIPKEESLLVLSAYRVAIISGALALPLSVFSAVVVGFQQMAVINISKNVISIVSVALSIMLLYQGIGLVALPIASIFVVTISSIVSFIYAKRYFPKLKIKISYCNKNDLNKLISFGGYFQLGRVANTIALSSDNIVIAGSLGAGSVTPYSFSSKLPIMFSVTLASKLPNAIFPAITEMFANKEMEKLRQTYKRLTFFAVRLALLGAAFLFIANSTFVKLWVGDDNYGGDFLNIVFVLWAIFDTVYRGTTAFVFASGDLKKWTIASFIEAILNFAVSLILIQPYGLVGVALGTLISKLLTTGFYTPYWVCQKLDLPKSELFKKSIFLPIIRSIPSIGITFLFSYYLILDNGWLWLILVGIFLVVTNFLMFEGLALSKSSNDLWKVRLRKLILMKDEY